MVYLTDEEIIQKKEANNSKQFFFYIQHLRDIECEMFSIILLKNINERAIFNMQSIQHRIFLKI